MRRTIVFGFVVPLGLAVTVYGATLVTRARAQVLPVEVPQPHEFVAFSAQVTVHHVAHEGTAGRFYRASDGSRRLETWGQVHPNEKVISIKNIPLATSYILAGGQWTSAPMDTDPVDYQPRRWKLSTPGLSPYPFRLALRDGEDGSLTAEQGFEAFQYIDRVGDVALMVPELNLFTAFKQSLSTGRREIYSSIVLGEPPPELFQLPVGANAIPIQRPRGIVKRVRP